MCADKNKSHKLITIIICCCKMLSCSHFSPNVFRLSRICAMSDAVLKLCYGDNRDLKIAVYGKRLTSRNSFVIKSKSSTVKYSSNTIYHKNLKCCTKTPCMTTETLSLMGNSLGIHCLTLEMCRQHLTASLTLELTFDVCSERL